MNDYLCIMKFLITLLLLCGLAAPTAQGREYWPDGSVIDGWFSRTPSVKKGRTFSILDYGAVPDSTVLQTEAIQRAIDAAAVRGGTVVVPRGVYLSGALFFKPRTRLLLEAGAVLKGSSSDADYPDVPVHIEGVLQPYVAALVNADGVDGFSITGEGVLDGGGRPYWEAFWQRRRENPSCTNLEVRRPRMVSVSGAKNITLRGITLRNAGFWNIHLYKCARVCLDGVTVYAPMGPLRAPSTDGVDIDACSDVHITGCNLSCGDDIIAVKGGKGPWADTEPQNGVNARILVENCVFGPGSAVITFGSECIGARNVIVRNSKAGGTDRLLWLKMRPDTPQHYAYITVEGIEGEVGRVLYIKPWTQFFDLKGRKDIPMSYASHVAVRGCNLKCRVERRVVDCPEQYVLEDVVVDGNKLKFKYNKEESKVKPYTLEDPLAGVSDPSEWPARRAEILETFQREMYGRMPSPLPFTLETLEEGETLGGAGWRRQVRMWFRGDHTGPHIDWMIILPQGAEGPVPAVMALNYYGNHTLLPDPEILVPDCWLDNSDRYGILGNRSTGASRGILAEPSPANCYLAAEIVDRGYAFVTACYGDVSPDPEDRAEQGELPYTGVFDLWGPRDPARTDNTTALAAWAWALMRGMDMLSADARIDADKVVVAGSSRLGKAALLAAAFDERFPVAVINQSGGGGIPLAKRTFGESVGSEVATYTHWYCGAYAKYAGDETALPFDQHLLVSCIAPRALLVEGFDNPWFDTYGEFLCLKAASPVWRFLGGEGLPDVAWPADGDTAAIGRDLGYVRRSGKHGFSTEDWGWLLDFAGRRF